MSIAAAVSHQSSRHVYFREYSIEDATKGINGKNWGIKFVIVQMGERGRGFDDERHGIYYIHVVEDMFCAIYDV
jgi:hypothetical protein